MLLRRWDLAVIDARPQIVYTNGLDFEAQKVLSLIDKCARYVHP